MTRDMQGDVGQHLMQVKPLSVAFVSGKGGVGKTMLAANFAWVCAKVAKTALIDLDFQNQGCTGLFAPHIRFTQANALEAMEKPEATGSQQLNQVAENVYFLPAVSWRRPSSQEEIAQHVHAPDFPQELLDFIRHLETKQEFVFVVLDCHGGVDPVSLAAFRSCDYTLMVTEADSVTFAGTLELLNYYETKSAETPSMRTPEASPSQSQGTRVGSQSMDSPPCVKFIVNRLPGKYRWKDLEHIYQQFMSKKLGTFTPDRSIFCYIPSEELLADSFGEYPFHVVLAPKSIFSKKIHYVAYSLLDGKYDLPSDYKPITRFRKDRYRRKIQKIVVSNELRNTRTVLIFFAWVSSLYAIFLVGLIPFLIASAVWPAWGKTFGETLETQPYLALLIAVGAGAFLSFFWYSIKAIFGLMFLYRDKHKFQKALFKSINPQLTIWQRLSLAKLLVLRIGTSIIPYFFAAYLVALVVLGLVWLIALVFTP